MKKLRIRAIPEGATRVASLVAGETDIIEEIPVDLLPSVERRKNLKIDAVESSVSLVHTFDTRKPPFNDVRVRRGARPRDRQAGALKQMLGGYGSVLDGQLVTKGTFGYNPNIKSRPYDPAKAKAMLAEAGFPKGFENKINTLSGRYLSDVDIANAVAGMMTPGRREDQRQRRRGRRVVPARPQPRPGADVSGRLVQRRRRRFQHRLVHRGEQAQLLDQRRVRQALAGGALDHGRGGAAARPTTA